MTTTVAAAAMGAVATAAAAGERRAKGRLCAGSTRPARSSLPRLGCRPPTLLLLLPPPLLFLSCQVLKPAFPLCCAGMTTTGAAAATAAVSPEGLTTCRLHLALLHSERVCHRGALVATAR